MLLRLFDDEGERKEFRIAIWNLLRGHNIIQTDVEFPFIQENHEPVSYTHLRAHETDSYLVCRLLLEKTSLARY